MRSLACRPMTCTPKISSVSFRNSTLAIPSPSPSASAFELALKCPVDLPSSNPSALALSLAWSSFNPTNAISGCVKHAAGTALWLTAWGRPMMFSTADMPCAEAACASIILPFASPMQYRLGTTSTPSFLVSTRILSSTGTNPLSISTPTFSRPHSLVLGTLPVATRQASTSRVSTCSLVFASIILMVTGFSPGMPGVTSDANTPVR
mmetsp:Transcript_17770/g.42716  ORF Transcript_17770/g.42716 Transcript_17770/m.42716 type:complete len:207 (-) Transcript_17770:1015-1635(-)